MAAPDTRVTEPTAYTPVLTDLSRLLRAPFSPGAVYGEQQDRPTFWMPWLLSTLAVVAVQLMLLPFQRRAMELAMAGAPAARLPSQTFMIVMMVIATFVVGLIMMVISAAILYALTGAMGGETTFKKMLTVVVFTMPLAVLTQLLAWVVLTMRGVDSITSRGDMMVSLGLDNLMPADVRLGAFLRFLLSGIGPVEIWSLAVCAVGIGVMAKMRKGQAWTAATIYFVVMLVVGAALKTLGARAGGGGI